MDDKDTLKFLRQAESTKMADELREQIARKLAALSHEGGLGTTDRQIPGWTGIKRNAAERRNAETNAAQQHNTEQRNAEEKRNASSREVRWHKMRRRLGGLGAGVAAVIVVGAVVAGVLYHGGTQGRNSTVGGGRGTVSNITNETATQSTQSGWNTTDANSIVPNDTSIRDAHGYGNWQAGDYAKILGFTPILPSYVSTGASLVETTVTSYQGIFGMKPDFQAMYTTGPKSQPTLSFQLEETLGAKSINLSQKWTPFVYQGHTLYKPKSNSEMVQFLYIKGDMLYGISFNDHLTDAEAGKILTSAPTVLADPPTLVSTSFSGLTGAKRALTFAPIVPKFIPDGYSQTTLYGNIVREKSKELREIMMITYQSSMTGSMTYSVSEGRVAPPQPEASTAVTGAAHQSEMDIQGHHCTVTTYAKTGGVVISWTDPTSGVWYQVGSSSVLEDVTTMEKVMASMLSQLG